jgi:glycosyltransferase involved in cell wall biosynthesis
MSEMARPAVSVIVPSYNSARTIRACLQSLLDQDTPLAYEVIVADSSTDDTPALVAAFAPRVTLVRSPTRLAPGTARNLGIREAHADIIAFTDADCLVARDWVAQVHRAHARHDAVGGRILNGTPGSLSGTALYLAEFVEFAGGPARRVASMPSCNISYKRRLLEQHGLFPEVPWGEEYILNHRLPDGVWFEPALQVRHVNRTGVAATAGHARKVGAGAALSRRATGQVGLLFRHRLLVPLLWGYRFAKIARESARNGQLAAFVLSAPILAVDLAAWTLGFFQASAPQSPAWPT